MKFRRQFLLALLRGCSTPGRLTRPHAHGVSEQLTNMNDLHDNEQSTQPHTEPKLEGPQKNRTRKGMYLSNRRRRIKIY